jgi:hypothetical protein
VRTLPPTDGLAGTTTPASDGWRVLPWLSPLLAATLP